MNELLFFGGFILLIGLLLAFDLGVLNKKGHAISFKESLILTLFWVCFGIAVFFLVQQFGHYLHGIDSVEKLKAINDHYLQKYDYSQTDGLASMIEVYNTNLSIEYITGYILEYALSVDNIFVMILILTAFKVPEIQYHRVLFWGILGAVVMRFLFIFLGAVFIARFTWLLYFFGAFLIYSGIKILVSKGEDSFNKDNKIVRWMLKNLPLKPDAMEQGFFVREHGKRYFTLLFVVLVMIEFTDLLFAVDSIPAIYGVTKDPYIIFFSNVFAILGLRSLFFLVSNVIQKFHMLQKALSLVLVFIGVKMVTELCCEQYHISNISSLTIIVSILSAGIVLSLLIPQQNTETT
jgi:tellurite resistance protein TerC